MPRYSLGMRVELYRDHGRAGASKGSDDDGSERPGGSGEYAKQAVTKEIDPPREDVFFYFGGSPKKLCPLYLWRHLFLPGRERLSNSTARKTPEPSLLKAGTIEHTHTPTPKYYWNVLLDSTIG